MNIDDENLEQLILDGIVEFAGMTQDGRMLYSLAQDLESTHPEIFQSIMGEHVKLIYSLWEKGFLHIDDITDPNPNIRVTNKALDKDEVSKLDYQLRATLEEILALSKE